MSPPRYNLQMVCYEKIGYDFPVIAVYSLDPRHRRITSPPLRVGLLKKSLHFYSCSRLQFGSDAPELWHEKFFDALQIDSLWTFRSEFKRNRASSDPVGDRETGFERRLQLH